MSGTLASSSLAVTAASVLQTSGGGGGGGGGVVGLNGSGTNGVLVNAKGSFWATHGRYCVGLLLLLAVVVIWVSSSEVTQVRCGSERIAVASKLMKVVVSSIFSTLKDTISRFS